MGSKDSRGSARYSASTKHNHIQADGKQRPAEDEQDIQQAQNTTTYFLMASKDQQRISWIIQQAQNTITYFLMAKQRPAEDEQDIQQAQNTITYPRWQGKTSRG